MAQLSSTNFNQPRDFPVEDRGTLVESTRYNPGVKDYGFTITATGISYEQLGWFLETCVKGSVAASTINGTGKRYVFSPNATATGDDLQSATFEFGDDTQAFRSTYCEGTSWSLGFSALTVGQAAPLTLTVNYLTQSLTSNTKTAGLTSPTVTSIVGTTGTWAVGNSNTPFASLGVVGSQLREFTISSDNKLGRKAFVDSPNLTFSTIGRGRRVTTFDAIFEGDANGVLRFTDWDLGVYKRMRLMLQDTATIAGSSPATTRKITLDGTFVLLTFDPIGTGPDGTNTVFHVTGRYIEDASLATANSDFQLTLDNDQASYS